MHLSVHCSTVHNGQDMLNEWIKKMWYMYTMDYYSAIKKEIGMDLKEAEGITNRWHEYTEELYKKHLHDPDNSPRARNPGMQSQVGLRKHHYKQS